ncbi:mitochondrial ribosomal protein MRP51 [Cercophora newfieldiana]|uniref:Mitochondrial ribosomal protein MRP51 n=1 Tax=Cercophora newfieldiana TaxID=92897 RepID=A0AA39XZY4_9PEZI|nr:mitochondrial ribosomal protein MRP51 [Cercophora newfieldiana]
MAARSVTPGGALLRTSRMFAIPAPIPPPSEATVGNKGSRSKTTAFPTHQIITTTNAARKRGDWGLKRPLPLRATTKATYAMLRVKEVDSIEGITDYSSATDLGMTLKKFQQLRLPITVPDETSPLTKDFSKPRKSAFEEDRDFTATDFAERVALVDKRWKFSGPWLAGMGHGEFSQWVEKKVRPRRAEFREFLKQRLAQETLQEDAQKAMDEGNEVPTVADASAISEERFMEYLRALRNNRLQLFDMVGQFLDLAPLTPPRTDSLTPRSGGSPYSSRGPPITHPSAGLSYLRSSAFVENHPFYGPQKEHPPVEARVVKPRRRRGAVNELKLGVAGFITEAPGGESKANQRSDVQRENGYAYDRIDITMKGGQTVWVQPREVTINSRGRVDLKVTDVDKEAYLVAQELLGADEKTTFRKPELERKPAMRAANIRQRFNPGQPRMSGASQYGLSSAYRTFKNNTKQQ